MQPLRTYLSERSVKADMLWNFGEKILRAYVVAYRIVHLACNVHRAMLNQLKPGVCFQKLLPWLSHLIAILRI